MNQLVRAILISVAIVASLFVLWYIRSVIAYVLISVVISILGRPIMHFFESKKFKPGLSAAFTLLILVLIMMGFFSLFVPIIQEEARIVSNIDQSVMQEALNDPISDFGIWLDDKGMIPEGETKDSFMKKKSADLFNYMKVSDLFNFFFAQIGNMFIGLMSILFITFFFLKDRSMIFKTIYSLTPDKNKGRIHEVLVKIKNTLTRYFYGICIQISLITLIVTVGLSILDVKHAFLIGFLAGVVNIIPYLGPIIGAFFGVLIGVSGNLEVDFYVETVPLLLKIVGVFALVQMLDNFIFQPYIFSNSVDAHPLEIFLVILSAGTLAGIIGMVLAVPTYSLIRVVAKEYYSEFTLVQTITKGMDENLEKPSLKVKDIKKMFIKDDGEKKSPEDQEEV